MAKMNQGDDMRDPRNQRDGASDQDKHGRKQNTATNAAMRRAAGTEARGQPGGPAHGGGSGKDRSGSQT
jgi:hypothetical protein